MRLFCILLLTAITLLGTTFAQTASKSRLVANVQNKTLADGCGCYFQFRGSKRNSEQYMFAESIEEDSAAWMNIDGRDVRLRLVKDWSKRDRELVGSRSTRTFATDNISVTSTYLATRVCAENDESCESTDYDATFVVRKGKRIQTVRAIGYCGC